MHTVALSRAAQKFLEKLDTHLGERITRRLRTLGNNPIPPDAKFITRDTGDKIFRYRIGSYRALYKIKTTHQTVLIIRIDKRPRIYHR